ncbi:uncharacterized protein L203_103755 [Cryptococcus depauperatus CBS 7841]|uniref:Uncharacterized protein n=1 Tax=Cryptococcus depauperatus CBS 7841 TaxID=1295531 RepID=A0AAJ8JU88_9TREE
MELGTRLAGNASSYNCINWSSLASCPLRATNVRPNGRPLGYTPSGTVPIGAPTTRQPSGPSQTHAAWTIYRLPRPCVSWRSIRATHSATSWALVNRPERKRAARSLAVAVRRLTERGRKVLGSGKRGLS